MYERQGWRLAPAYDLNPVPLEVKPRILETSVEIDGDNSASLDLAVSASEHFDLRVSEARLIAGDVARAVGRWRQRAKKNSIPSDEIDRMESAFEHEDSVKARKW